MELRQLRYFVAIAEERHFGRAAERLQIATPTLSQQLRVLERNLGVVLVDRSPPGTVSLTRSGDVLLRHARILLSGADRARDDVNAAADQPEQILIRVAPGAEIILAGQLHRLTDDTTLGAITMTSSTTDALLAVREGSGDAAIVWDGPEDTQGLTTLVLCHVAMHLALPASHRLAAFPCIDVADLADESIVLYPRTLAPDNWDTMQHHLLAHGISRPGQIITESNATNGPIAVLRSVAAGKGVAATVARLAEQAHQPGVVFRPLTPPAHAAPEAGLAKTRQRRPPPRRRHPAITMPTRLTTLIAGPRSTWGPADCRIGRLAKPGREESDKMTRIRAVSDLVGLLANTDEL